MDREAKNMTLYVLYDLTPYSLPFDFSPSLKALAEKYEVPYDTIGGNLRNGSANRSAGFTIEKITIPDEDPLTNGSF